MSENKFQHLHIHEECHDPNCTEHHHHHDEECHDPNCTEHHHHHGEECHDPNCMEHHHHHHDEECHDPNCTEHHHHHHHDEECHDPNCTEHHHHHNKHEDAVKDSLIMSCTRSFHGPRTAAQLREMGEKTFLRLGEMICVEGVVAGHLKGVIEAEKGSIAFSLTRAGVVDITELDGWSALDKVDSYAMTVNIMSIIPAPVTEEDIFSCMK